MVDGIKKITPDALHYNESAKKPPAGENFVDVLKGFVNDVDSKLREADKKMQAFSVQKESNIHEVMIAMEKADLSLRFLVRIRNKLVEAYQEIMRMQV